MRKSERAFGVVLREDIIERLKLESTRRDVFIRSIVEEALDTYLPQIKMVVSRPAERRAASSR
jgi:hypothetical protein